MRDRANRVTDVPNRRVAGESEDHWLENLELWKDTMESDSDEI